LIAADSLLLTAIPPYGNASRSMSGFRILVLFAALIYLPQSAVQAAEVSSCLSKEQRQTVQASGKVVPLASAKHAVPAHKGEVVRAKLCQRPSGLVYLLTLLARDGKVTQVTIDASSGRLAGR
jgi:uncharacterized membrane protein YkoI